MKKSLFLTVCVVSILATASLVLFSRAAKDSKSLVSRTDTNKKSQVEEKTPSSTQQDPGLIRPDENTHKHLTFSNMRGVRLSVVWIFGVQKYETSPEWSIESKTTKGIRVDEIRPSKKILVWKSGLAPQEFTYKDLLNADNIELQECPELKIVFNSPLNKTYPCSVFVQATKKEEAIIDFLAKHCRRKKLGFNFSRGREGGDYQARVPSEAFKELTASIQIPLYTSIKVTAGSSTSDIISHRTASCVFSKSEPKQCITFNLDQAATLSGQIEGPEDFEKCQLSLSKITSKSASQKGTIQFGLSDKGAFSVSDLSPGEYIFRLKQFVFRQTIHFQTEISVFSGDNHLGVLHVANEKTTIEVVDREGKPTRSYMVYLHTGQTGESGMTIGLDESAQGNVFVSVGAPATVSLVRSLRRFGAVGYHRIENRPLTLGTHNRVVVPTTPPLVRLNDRRLKKSDSLWIFDRNNQCVKFIKPRRSMAKGSSELVFSVSPGEYRLFAYGKDEFPGVSVPLFAKSVRLDNGDYQYSIQEMRPKMTRCELLVSSEHAGNYYFVTKALLRPPIYSTSLEGRKRNIFLVKGLPVYFSSRKNDQGHLILIDETHKNDTFKIRH